MSNKKSAGRITHALESSIDIDSVTRTFALVRFSSGDYSVRMITDWKDGTPPTITNFGLSPIGLTMLSDLLDHAHELHRFPAVDADESESEAPS